MQAAFQDAGKPTQAEIAKALGVKQAGVSKWKSGENIPRVQYLVETAKQTGVSLEWLITGAGERFAGDKADPLAVFLASLDEDTRKEVLEFARFRSSKNKQ